MSLHKDSQGKKKKEKKKRKNAVQVCLILYLCSESCILKQVRYDYLMRFIQPIKLLVLHQQRV
jgi:hypothetical protein